MLALSTFLSRPAYPFMRDSVKSELGGEGLALISILRNVMGSVVAVVLRAVLRFTGEAPVEPDVVVDADVAVVQELEGLLSGCTCVFGSH